MRLTRDDKALVDALRCSCGDPVPVSQREQKAVRGRLKPTTTGLRRLYLIALRQIGDGLRMKWPLRGCGRDGGLST